MFKCNPTAGALRLAFGGLAGVLLAAPPASAQQQPPAASGDTQVLQRVEVTGSNIRRIAGETATPVQTITQQDIVKSGVTNTEQLLRTITAVDPSGVTTTSSVSSATTGGLSGASLRGLGSNRTLVLINGRRIAPYGTVGDAVSIDINSIPLAAIERVEVLTQGASAIYGSDAIAGVINFILRRDFEGLEVDAQYGSAKSNAYEVQASAVYGLGDLTRDKFNANVLFSYQKANALYGADRDFARSSINEAAQQDLTSGNTFPANIAIPGVGSRNPLAGNCAPSITDPFFPPNVCRYDPAEQVSLVPDTETWNLMANGRYAFGNGLEAYAELALTRRKITNQIQAVPLSDQFALPASNPLFNQAPYFGLSTFQLSPTSPYYPAAFIAAEGGDPTQPVLVRYRALESGNRVIENVADQPRIVLGLQGSGWGWDFNASYLYTQSTLTEETINGFPQYTKILPLLNSGGVNPFGPSTPEVQAQIRAANFYGQTYENETSLQSLQLTGSRELWQLPGGPLALALGGEWRKEGFNAQPSQLLIQGDVSGYGGNQAPVDESRNVYSLYGEINVPIIRTLEATAAVRYDDYENVGNRWTPQVSAKWTPLPGLLVRGAWGQGFRAPSLVDLYATVTEGASAIVSDPLRCPTTGSSLDCATQFNQTAGGNPGLSPETSTNTTLGFVFEPSNQVNFGMTAWWIELEDVILSGGLGAATILGSLDQFGSYVTRGPVDPALPDLPGQITLINSTAINQGTTKLAGYDFSLNLRSATTPYGNFSLGFNGTYTYRYDLTLPDGSVDEAVGTFSGNIAGAGASGAVPRWKQYLTLGWTLGPWNATVANRYQRGYQDFPGNFADTSDPAYVPTRVDAYSIWNLQAGYTGLKDWTFLVGINNVLDTDPPYTTGGGQFFQAGYDPSYVNPLGRFLYGRVIYRWG